MNYLKKTEQAGFTIVELTIATLVFSVILLVITYGVLSFTHSYYKGVNSSSTQNTARSILDTISQAIQFSGSTIAPNDASHPNFFCAANNVYVLAQGTEYQGDAPTSANPGLYALKMDCPDASWTPPGNLTGGTQLLAPHMRIANLQITNPNPADARTYAIKLSVAYGDSDLLCSSSLPSSNADSCNASTPNTDPKEVFTAGDMNCRSQTGSQFCAVSSLQTTVLKRQDSTD